MGPQNKLLIDIEGQSVVRRIAKLLVDYGLEELVVVVGHEASLVTIELKDLPLTIVENKDYKYGQMTSVHTGVAALTKPSDGIMVCLSDLVLLEHADLHALHLAFDACKTTILVPQYKGQRGNPIILAASQREAILAGEKNLGCRKLIQRKPDEVTVFESANDHLSFDLDTPEALERLRLRLHGANNDS
jgi:molybdenum cofactor cytidylyltransferase